MKKALLVVTALLFTCQSFAAKAESIAPPGCDYGERSADVAAAFSQFEFLIGDFEIEGFGWFNNRWYTNPNATVPPRWNGYYGLNGKAIVDEWFNEDPGITPETHRGINVRMFDEKAAEWKMMWISTVNHTVQDLRAKVIDGKLTMWQVYPERPTFKAEFEVLSDSQWQRTEYIKDENGNWNQRFKLVATRIPCP